MWEFPKSWGVLSKSYKSLGHFSLETYGFWKFLGILHFRKPPSMGIKIDMNTNKKMKPPFIQVSSTTAVAAGEAANARAIVALGPKEATAWYDQGQNERKASNQHFAIGFPG